MCDHCDHFWHPTCLKCTLCTPIMLGGWLQTWSYLGERSLKSWTFWNWCFISFIWKGMKENLPSRYWVLIRQDKDPGLIPVRGTLNEALLLPGPRSGGKAEAPGAKELATSCAATPAGACSEHWNCWHWVWRSVGHQGLHVVDSFCRCFPGKVPERCCPRNVFFAIRLLNASGDLMRYWWDRTTPSALGPILSGSSTRCSALIGSTIKCQGSK